MVRYLQPSPAVGEILVKVYVGAFVEPMVQRSWRRGTEVVMDICKARYSQHLWRPYDPEEMLQRQYSLLARVVGHYD